MQKQIPLTLGKKFLSVKLHKTSLIRAIHHTGDSSFSSRPNKNVNYGYMDLDIRIEKE